MTGQAMRRLLDHVAGCPQCTPHNTCRAARVLVRQVREETRARRESVPERQ